MLSDRLMWMQLIHKLCQNPMRLLTAKDWSSGTTSLRLENHGFEFHKYLWRKINVNTFVNIVELEVFFIPRTKTSSTHPKNIT